MKTKMMILAIIASMGFANVFAQQQTATNTQRKHQHQQVGAKKQVAHQHANKMNSEEFQKRHTQMVKQRLMMDDATTLKFEPIYNKYMEDMKALRSERQKNAKVEAKTDKEIMDRMEKRFENQQKMLDLKKKYFNQFKKILNPKQIQSLFGNHRKMNFHRNNLHNGMKFDTKGNIRSHRNQRFNKDAHFPQAANQHKHSGEHKHQNSK